jgi:hypothetical protein
MPSQMALRAATHAFLLKDYVSALRKLSDALSNAPSSDSIWHEQLDQETEDKIDELRRKILLLLITLCASIWTSNPEILSKATDLPPLLQSLASANSKRPFTCYQPLYQSCLSFYGSTGDLQRLPPSIIVALALAALKLNLPQDAKKLINEWDASLSESTRQLLAEEGQAMQEARSLESSVQSLSDRRGLSESMEDSTILNTSRIRAATISYERLMEVYCLAILPRLEDWKGASDRIERASYASGGILSQAKCEVRS